MADRIEAERSNGASTQQKKAWHAPQLLVVDLVEETESGVSGSFDDESNS